MDERVSVHLRALTVRSGTRGTQERKIQRNFYRHADILTLLVVRLIGLCGRDFTTESRATPIVLREKRGFLPRFDVCAVIVSVIRRRNNDPRNGSTQFVGIQRTEAAGCGGLWLRVHCIAGRVGNTF